MNDPATRLVDAQLREREARERFAATAERLKRRVSVEHLKHDVGVQGRRARSSAFRAVRQNPATAAGVLASILLVAARKPIARWLGGSRSRAKPYRGSKPANPKSLED